MSGTHQLLIDISALRPIHATAEFADEARRDAQRYTQSDVGKVVKVLSPLKWWLIVAVSRGTATFRELAADIVNVDASEVANDSGVAGETVQAALDTLSSKVAAAGVASHVSNDSSVAGATVKDALDSLSGLLGFGAVSSVFGRTGAVTAHSGDYTAAQVGAPPVARTITAGTGLTGGGDLTANRTLSADFGQSAGKVCQGNDARLSDARTPLAHALTHLPGGPDALACGPASSLSVGGSSSEGAAMALARQDHTHALPPFGSAAGTFCQGNDPRLNDARTPIAHALSHLPGGPDGLASGVASSLSVGGSNSEGAASAFARQDHTHALPPFGSTGGTFCEGGDARLSDARTPLAHALSHLPGGADGLASGPASSLSAGGSNAEGIANAFARQDHIHALPPFGTTSSTFCEGSDARLSDARTPIAHALTHAPGAPDGLPIGAPVAVGTDNSAGTAVSYARADHVHDASALLPRDGSRPLTGTLDAGGNNITNVGAVFEAPASFAWVANAATLDIGVKNDFAANAALTGNSTITLSNGVEGAQGNIYVKQDATGGRALGFVVPGRTILREAGAMDSNPQPGANTVTGYAYDFKTIAGTAYVIIARYFLS